MNNARAHSHAFTPRLRERAHVTRRHARTHARHQNHYHLPGSNNLRAGLSNGRFVRACVSSSAEKCHAAPAQRAHMMTDSDDAQRAREREKCVRVCAVCAHRDLYQKCSNNLCAHARDMRGFVPRKTHKHANSACHALHSECLVAAAAATPPRRIARIFRSNRRAPLHGTRRR